MRAGRRGCGPEGVSSLFGSSFREFLQFEPRFVVFRTASGVGFPNFTLSGLWISREQEPSVAFHHLDFFLLVAFSRGLHESFSTCLAKDTTEATSPSVRVLPLECCLLRPCPFLHAQLLLLRYVALPQLAFPVDGICALTSSSTDLRSTATYLRSSLLLRTLRHRRSKSSSVEQSRIKAARRFEQLQRQPIPFLELRLGPR